jgi:hypothetical protein
VGACARRPGVEPIEHPERVEQPSTVGVGVGVADQLRDDPDIDVPAERPHEADRQARQLDRQVQHEAAQPVGDDAFDRTRGLGEQVGFVVPLGTQGRVDRRADADCLPTPQ